jgi:hypothetical protein
MSIRPAVFETRLLWVFAGRQSVCHAASGQSGRIGDVDAMSVVPLNRCQTAASRQVTFGAKT